MKNKLDSFRFLLYDKLMSLMSGKKLLLLGFAIVLLIAIPLTVYLVGQQSKTKVGATASTTLSFVVPTPSPSPIAVGQSFPVEVWADPSTVAGVTNKISFAKLSIKYEPTKLSVGAGCLTVNQEKFPATLQTPVCDTSGVINVTVSAGNTDTTAVAAKTRIATVTFTALLPGSTILSFDYKPDSTSPTQVLSVGNSDQFNENVLIQPLPTTITIAGGASPSPSPSSSPGSATLPVCTNLSLDRAATGAAPYPVTFTATGNGVNGATISKVSFIFGDGQTQDVTAGGGIGSGTVNGVSIAHSYAAAGTFTAKATLTDNKNAVSDATTASCNKTITVTAAAAGGGGGTAGTVVVTVPPAATATPVATLAPTPTITPISSLPPTGPVNLISAGAVGAILSILGVIIFLAL